MIHSPFILVLAALFILVPQAEAKDLAPGTRVAVKGRLKRLCAAKVEAVPASGFATLKFDYAACGDSAQPYKMSQLQKLDFVKKSGAFQPGDFVTLQGFHGHACSARIQELSRGYAALEFDSLLCADTEGLRKLGELTKVNLVSEKEEFSLGQRVRVQGIQENESCQGTIRRLTDSGLAAIDFEQLTCAYGGKLYSLDQLTRTAAPAAANVKRKKISGEMIFQQVMREIATAKGKTAEASVKSDGI